MIKKSLWFAVVVLVGMLAFAGCEEEAAEPVDEQEEHDYDEEITFEVIDKGEDEVVAYVHIDHWHGDLPEVAEGDNLSLGAYILEDEEEVELDGDYHALGVGYADGADQDVVSFDLHGDHVHIIGEHEGSADVVFQLLHDGAVDYETPPITVKVE